MLILTALSISLVSDVKNIDKPAKGDWDFKLKKLWKVDARSDHNLTPLIEAAHLGHLEVVKIFVHNGADVNAATKKGWTSLMWSEEMGHVEVVRFLLQSGADKTPKNNRGKTAVEIAEAKGQQEVVKMLREEQTWDGACECFNVSLKWNR